MTAWGALIGLILSIILIAKKIQPVYSLILGAVAGGLIGGFTLPDTVAIMLEGVKDITPAILRILAAGVLSGVLVKTGAAAAISNAIVDKLGERHTFLALALATMLLTAIGVFVDVAVITVAPVALSLGQRLAIPKASLLLIMVGGGKCGNIISPNPNTIIAAENFNAALPDVMFANVVPAVVGLLFVVYVLSRFMPRGGALVAGEDLNYRQGSLPSLGASMVAPVATIALLALRPVCGVVIDPMIALPVGGLAGILAMRRWAMLKESLSYGLEKMSFVAILLVGTGAIAGIIKASTIKEVLLSVLSGTNMGEVLIAPVSGALMSAATASSTAGATVASSSFAETVLAAGISAVWGAAMINSGATVLDHLPHGSFFHATGGSVGLAFRERLKLIPYETSIGLVLALGTILAYLLTK